MQDRIIPHTAGKSFRRYLIWFLVICIVAGGVMTLLYVKARYLSGTQRENKFFSLQDQAIEEYDTRVEAAYEEYIDYNCGVACHLETLLAILESSADPTDENDPGWQAMLDINRDVDGTQQLCFITDSEGNVLAMPGEGKAAFFQNLMYTMFDNISGVPGMTEESKEAILAGTDTPSSSDGGTDAGTAPIVVKGTYLKTLVYSHRLKDANGADTGKCLILLQVRETALESIISKLTPQFMANLDDELSVIYINTADNVVSLYGSIDGVNSNALSQGDCLGLNVSKLKDKDSGTLRVNGSTYQYRVRRYTSSFTGECCFIAIWPYTESGNSSFYVIFPAVYLAGCAAILFYAMVLSRDRKRVYAEKDYYRPGILKGSFSVDRVRVRKLLPACCLVLVVVCVVSYCATSVSLTTDALREMQDYRESVVEQMDVIAYYAKQAVDEGENDYIAEALTTAHYIEAIGMDTIKQDNDGPLLTYYKAGDDGTRSIVTEKEGDTVVCLSESSEILRWTTFLKSMDSYTIYDLDGYALFTSQVGRPERITQGSFGYGVLMGDKTYDVYTSGTKTKTTHQICVPISLAAVLTEGEATQYITLRDKPGILKRGGNVVDRDGVLILEYTDYQMDSYQSSADEQTISAYLSPQDGSRILTAVFNADGEHTTYYSPTDALGVALTQDQLPEEAFSGSYYGFANVATDRYLIYSSYFKTTIGEILKGQKEDGYVTLLMPVLTLYEDRPGQVFLVCGIAALTMLLLLLSEVVTLTSSIRIDPPVPPESAEEKMLEEVKSDSLADWKKMGPGQKEKHFLMWMAVIATVWIAVRYINRNSSVTALNYVLTKKWMTGANVFSLTGMIMLLTAIIAFSYLLKQLLRAMARYMDNRGRTIVNLISSIAQYFFAVIAIFYGLYLCGVDTALIITGASATTLLISLGSQNVVKDIIAGLFFLIEGTFNVGDIVTVGGFCGKVTEIGLRTIQLEDRNGNIKIMTNGTVKDVLNMTSKFSRVRIDLDIPSRVPIAQVEDIFRKEFAEIEKSSPVPHGPIRYMGVEKIGPQVNYYRLECSCAEEDTNELYRYLNRQFSLLLKEKGLW